jgi:hypothetical protein
MLLGCFPVSILSEPVRSHIPKEYVDIPSGDYFFQLQGIFDGMAAAYPAAVISVRVSAAHALDHYQILGLNDRFRFRGDPLSQLQVGEYPVVFAIKVFDGFIHIRADRDDGCPVFYLFDPALSFSTR